MIRAGADAFVKAFNEADAEAIAAPWTEDCEYIDEREIPTLAARQSKRATRNCLLRMLEPKSG